jgi:hypothetical protein
MQHLAIERLAELADSEPTAEELEHLAGCAMCSAERTAYHRVVSMAADERRRIAPPVSNWGSLSTALRQQGIITTRAEAAAQRAFVAQMTRFAWQAAAGIAILVTGLVTGRVTAGMPLRTALALDNGEGTLASQVAMTPEDFSSTASAMQVLQRAQQDYERAALYLANHDTSTSEGASEAYRTTLAALDEMAETSLRALSEAPADPIMNQVYFTTLGARNMTLGKLATALPTGSRLSRF